VVDDSCDRPLERPVASRRRRGGRGRLRGQAAGRAPDAAASSPSSS
jgi:hypothetical protein